MDASAEFWLLLRQQYDRHDTLCVSGERCAERDVHVLLSYVLPEMERRFREFSAGLDVMAKATAATQEALDRLDGLQSEVQK